VLLDGEHEQAPQIQERGVTQSAAMKCSPLCELAHRKCHRKRFHLTGVFIAARRQNVSVSLAFRDNHLKIELPMRLKEDVPKDILVISIIGLYRSRTKETDRKEAIESELRRRLLSRQQAYCHGGQQT
jgi:hypothetical protein